MCVFDDHSYLWIDVFVYLVSTGELILRDFDDLWFNHLGSLRDLVWVSIF